MNADGEGQAEVQLRSSDSGVEALVRYAVQLQRAAAMGEAHGQRSALHHMSSPVNAVSCLHVDMAVPNFGIQEWAELEPLYELFPNAPAPRPGMSYRPTGRGSGSSSRRRRPASARRATRGCRSATGPTAASRTTEPDRPTPLGEREARASPSNRRCRNSSELPGDDSRAQWSLAVRRAKNRLAQHAWARSADRDGCRTRGGRCVTSSLVVLGSGSRS